MAALSGAPHLVIMAKAPEAGSVKTRLCPPLAPAEAALCAEAFLHDAIALARAAPAGGRVLAYAPAEARERFAEWAPDFALVAQRGDDLGARLLGCVEDVLAGGASGAIVIGTDSPTLPPSHLEAAVRRLGEADVVLGPSEDGGYYLIGLVRAWPALFSGIAWSTAAVLEQTLERARRLNLRVALLPPWFDVDTPADLERLGADLAAASGGAHHTRRFLAGWAAKAAGR